MARLSTGARAALLETGSFKNIFANFVVMLYESSVMPSSADAAEVGNLLAVISLNGGAVTAGQPTNCLNWGAVTHNANNTIATLARAAETAKGVGLKNGTIGYGRLYANDMVTGVSLVSPRMDGNVLTTSGADFVTSSKDVKLDVEVNLTELNINFPYK